MSRTRQYYEQELSALREQGKRFSERFPKLAPFLGQGTKDPDIERLLEGFAFVGSKLWAKIDDAYPELAEQFLDILAPGYFSVLPSATVLQFKPNPAIGKKAKSFPRGTEMMATKNDEPFLLTSCYDVCVEPLQLNGFNKRVKQDQTHLTLSFKMLYDRSAQDLTKPIRLYLNGDLRETYFLSYLLTKKLTGIYFNVGKEKHKVENAKFKRLGLSASESLIPFYDAYYHSFSLLTEYFSFPEKFMFLELENLNFKDLPAAKSFDLEVVLDFDDRTNFGVTAEHFQLHCVPAVNLFKADAEPLTHEGAKIAYPLRVQNFKDAAVHSVLNVEAFSESRQTKFEYVAARNFPVLEQGLHRYQGHLRESLVHDHPDVYLELWSPEHTLEKQTVTTEVLSYQPNAFLEVNGIKMLANDKSTLGVEFTNLNAFTMPVYPPLSQEVIWQLIAHLSFKFKNLQEVETLRELILAYDFAGFQPGGHHAMGKKLATSMLELKTIPKQNFYKGEIFYGHTSSLSVKEDVFLNTGEIDLFGSIFAEILKEHAPFNSYHELSIKGVQTGIALSWPTAFS